MSDFKKADFRRALKIVQWKFEKGVISEPQFDMSEIICPIGQSSSFETRGKPTVSICGTAACIGGWMAIELGATRWYEANNLMATATGQSSFNPKFDVGLHNLFYGFPVKEEKRTIKHAISAIKRYFAGNRNPWRVPVAELDHV